MIDWIERNIILYMQEMRDLKQAQNKNFVFDQ